MASPPYRIERERPSTGTLEETRQPDPMAGFKEYLSRLLKMIPAEIVGLYMIGSGIIPTTELAGAIAWPAICLILLVVLRVWGTADPDQSKPSQPVPVFISAIAFMIWLYWLGGPFILLKIHIGWIASLLVLIWSFIIPIFYKGEIK